MFSFTCLLIVAATSVEFTLGLPFTSFNNGIEILSEPRDDADQQAKPPALPLSETCSRMRALNEMLQVLEKDRAEKAAKYQAQRDALRPLEVAIQQKMGALQKTREEVDYFHGQRARNDRQPNSPEKLSYGILVEQQIGSKTREALVLSNQIEQIRTQYSERITLIDSAEAKELTPINQQIIEATDEITACSFRFWTEIDFEGTTERKVLLKRLQDLEPESGGLAPAVFHLAFIKLRLGQRDEAKSLLHSASRLDARLLQLVRLGDALCDCDGSQEGLQKCREFLEKNKPSSRSAPNDYAYISIQWLRLFIAAELGDFKEFETALVRLPKTTREWSLVKNRTLLHCVCHAWLNKNNNSSQRTEERMKEQMQSSIEAIERWPYVEEDWFSQLSIGLALSAEGSKENQAKAQNALRKACHLAPASRRKYCEKMMNSPGLWSYSGPNDP